MHTKGGSVGRQFLLLDLQLGGSLVDVRLPQELVPQPERRRRRRQRPSRRRRRRAPQAEGRQERHDTSNISLLGRFSPHFLDNIKLI